MKSCPQIPQTNGLQNKQNKVAQSSLRLFLEQEEGNTPVTSVLSVMPVQIRVPREALTAGKAWELGSKRMAC